MSDSKRMLNVEELDRASWSEGKRITEMDKQKIALACERFFMDRGYVVRKRRVRRERKK